MDWKNYQLNQDPDLPAEADGADVLSVEQADLASITDISLTRLMSAGEAAGLMIEEDVYVQVLAALTSGKHVILTGPPGTAKTSLAQVIASAAHEAGVCTGYVATTATADWTTYETIGGLRPKGLDQLEFQEGQFLQALRAKRWLIIDELNRAQFDRAFGQLFTLLSGHPVVLPYSRPGQEDRPLVLLPHGLEIPSFPCDVLVVPSSWRIIATMNVFDKSLLFQMSFALMRRFAFVEVPSPAKPVFEFLIDRAAAGDRRAAHLAGALLPLRTIKDLGPAIYIDLARFLQQRIAILDSDEGQLLLESFYSYLLPQFEGIDDESGMRLFKVLKGVIAKPELIARLQATLSTVLGVELTPLTAAVDDSEEFGDSVEKPVSDL